MSARRRAPPEGEPLSETEIQTLRQWIGEGATWPEDADVAQLADKREHWSYQPLEFENHRPLYNWYCEKLGIHHPRQIEFAKLQLNTLLMGKRYMLRMVKEGYVSGWDDPRMPTISGLRRRGFTSEKINEIQMQKCLMI